ncbi:heat-inducible transcriptional repressor HrcA [Algiphilus sp.]|uniref:heat-inducible transcriptional repressor HrcA n=1 Tax=Algiphilus sp. TaxID=1872431 RepID=UPI001CA76C14|nr:heat-inducible transcriptional repressor HrcA [Algiphilus sp.]MBY8966468.1 heat-inducible transcription repressor HrcA [Algiphilus acroporae]MCI5063810.1 heat-inducible transcriptional repressor HrcA [Algiphilus sp.]MCI5103699.1 heat-inducible transcriptional repressor HrcA [Algiphilus sp.]MCR9089857.1 heat-inducible transcriptional repressor HrcA [Pseudomonadota bacterium]
MATLDKRAAWLLKLLIERYILDGQPVASRQLSRAVGNSLSPATIRNVMADLDDMGFVCSPHTSAGRIPTHQGYRVFVDSLLEPERMPSRVQQRVMRAILGDGHADAENMLQAATSVLSSVSTMAGVLTVPRRNRALLRRIEFLPLSGSRVLAILVVNQHEVQNRVLETEREYSASELEQFANAINAHYVGRDLLALREALRQEVGAAKQDIDASLKDALGLLSSAAPTGEDEGDMMVAGGANLFGYADLAQIDRLHGLFEALDRKRDLLAIFDRCLDGQGVQLFIGEESGYRVLDECSVVTAPYSVNGQTAGVIGVIGPTRMAYGRIIPLVRDTAKILSQGLKVS